MIKRVLFYTMRNIIPDLYLHYLLISYFAYDGIGIEPLHYLIHVDDKVFACVYLFFQRRNGFIAEQLARTYVRYAIAAAFGGRTDIDTEKQSATFYQHIDQSVLVKAEVAAVRAEDYVVRKHRTYGSKLHHDIARAYEVCL